MTLKWNLISNLFSFLLGVALTAIGVYLRDVSLSEFKEDRNWKGNIEIQIESLKELLRQIEASELHARRINQEISSKRQKLENSRENLPLVRKESLNELNEAIVSLEEILDFEASLDVPDEMDSEYVREQIENDNARGNFIQAYDSQIREYCQEKAVEAVEDVEELEDEVKRSFIRLKISGFRSRLI